MRNGKRALFSFWDGGFGHLKRILSIANYLSSFGYSIGVICAKKFVPLLSDIDFISNIFVIENRKKLIHRMPYQLPVYSHAFRHAQRLCGLEFNDTKFLNDVVKKEIQVIKEFKPKVIINDYRDTIKIASEYTNTPIVGITTSNGNSAGYPMGWWVPGPDDLVLPDCRNSFNEIRKKYGLKPITDERESFEGDFCIIPSCKTLDPLISPREKDVYVGLLNKSLNSNPKSKLSSLVKSKKVIFWYMGEGNNRPECNFDYILEKIINELDAYFIVAGSKQRYKKTESLSKICENVHVDDFYSGEEYDWIIENSSAIINHGSTTSMLGLSQGVPFITIPWNTESNMAIWGSKYGAGIYLSHSSEPLERRYALDLGKNVEIMGYWSSKLTCQSVLESLNDVLVNPVYREKAQDIAKELNRYDGYEAIFNIVEKEI